MRSYLDLHNKIDEISLDSTNSRESFDHIKTFFIAIGGNRNKRSYFSLFPCRTFCLSHLLSRTNCKFLQSSCCPLINDHVRVRWRSEWFRYSLVAPGEVGLTLTSLALLLLGNWALMKLFHLPNSSLCVCETIFTYYIIRYYCKINYQLVSKDVAFVQRRLFDNIQSLTKQCILPQSNVNIFEDLK